MTTIFSPRINWDAGYKQRFSYVTDIWRSRSGLEQRRMIRQIPRRTDVFSVMPQFAQESGLLDSLLYGGPALEWAVPFWPHETRITAEALAGATSLTCDTTDREFAIGGKAILWTGETATELVDVTSVAAGTLGVSALVGNWPVNTLVFPAHLANITARQSILRASPSAGVMEVTFDLTDIVDPAIATASPSVFAATDPNRRDDPTDTIGRAVMRYDTPSYLWLDTVRETTPVYSWAASLFLDSKALVKTCIDWFHAHRGSFKAFWMPSYDVDFELASPASSGDSALTIKFMNYTALQFPFESRRHIAIVGRNGAVVHRRVTASVDNGNGTETLTLNGTVGRALDNTDMLSFLRYVRFSTDTMEIDWKNQGLAESSWEFTEIPKETPTS